MNRKNLNSNSEGTTINQSNQSNQLALIAHMKRNHNQVNGLYIAVLIAPQPPSLLSLSLPSTSSSRLPSSRHLPPIPPLKEKGGNGEIGWRKKGKDSIKKKWRKTGGGRGGIERYLSTTSHRPIQEPPPLLFPKHSKEKEREKKRERISKEFIQHV